MIKEDLVAERVAIDSYREMIAYLGDHDTTSAGSWKRYWLRKKSTPTTGHPAAGDGRRALTCAPPGW
jgi:hypothetical protein